MLGHDFHSKHEYEKSRDRGFEDPNSSTWRNLPPLLCDAGIALADCFFTNLFMGLRLGRATTGPFPGARDQQFVKRCLDFLATQIALQQPRLILTLGTHVPRRLAQLSPDLAHWRDARSFRALDKCGPLGRNVHFDGLPTKCTVAALTHPSLRPVNVGRRRYRGLAGEAAELSVLRHAFQVAGR